MRLVFSSVESIPCLATKAGGPAMHAELGQEGYIPPHSISRDGCASPEPRELWGAQGQPCHQQVPVSGLAARYGISASPAGDSVALGRQHRMNGRKCI